MGKKYKVAYATGSRADYGIVRRYLKYLNEDVDILLEILVTGALLNSEFGNQVNLINNDNFVIGGKVKVVLDTSSNRTIIHSMADILDGFAELFEKKKYDLLIILGDRYEIFMVAIAAAMQRIPILHIHGGEATYANYDEFIRHSITKMAAFHFTSTDTYRERVIQMGERPDHVFNLGALGAENCQQIDFFNVPEDIKNLSPSSYLVVLLHPETLSNSSPEKQVQILLNVLEKVNCSIIVIGSNADTYSNIIRSKIKKFSNNHDNVKYIENLHPDAYHYLVKNSICLVGNSSSGIIEAPTLGVYTINIGKRQWGRVMGNSVICTDWIEGEILNAIYKVMHNKKDNKKFDNPYVTQNTANMYYEKTKYILLNIHEYTGMKEFYVMENRNEKIL